jgi:hypothetical protein
MDHTPDHTEKKEKKELKKKKCQEDMFQEKRIVMSAV